MEFRIRPVDSVWYKFHDDIEINIVIRLFFVIKKINELDDIWMRKRLHYLQFSVFIALIL
jgi:hypothetical protein